MAANLVHRAGQLLHGSCLLRCAVRQRFGLHGKAVRILGNSVCNLLDLHQQRLLIRLNALREGIFLIQLRQQKLGFLLLCGGFFIICAARLYNGNDDRASRNEGDEKLYQSQDICNKRTVSQAQYHTFCDKQN